MTDGPGDEQTVAITGGTSGIGRAAALRLARRGATVAVVGRDEERGESVVAAAGDAPGEIRFHPADLAEQAAVRSLAEELRETYDRLDVLALNAGVSTAERRESPDGVELTFAVNHLAPYLLTHELVDLLAESASKDTAGASDGTAGASDGTQSARVVVTASGLHREADLDFSNLQFETGYDTMAAYSRSKLANVAFTLELAERLAGTGVTANCFTPGFVPGTSLFRDLGLVRKAQVRIAGVLPFVGTDVESGAAQLVEVATDPAYAERTGEYVEDGSTTEPSETARDPAVRDRLWRESAQLVGVEPDWPALQSTPAPASSDDT